MSEWIVIQGDCLSGIPKLVAEGVRVDAVVTDPPYGLEFMGKEWDAPWKYGMRPYGMADTKGRLAGPSFSSSRNPMCKVCHKHQRGSKSHTPCRCEAPQFDEIEHQLKDMARYQQWSEAWAREAIQILKPGGYLVAFGGTRTYHRMVCGLEGAGFVIQDTIAWLYGTGFPKNKAHIKPAHEPIVLAYKPGGKRVMQIDECRIGDFVNETAPGTDRFNQANFERGYRPNAYGRPWCEARRNEESDENRKAYGKGLAGSKAIENTRMGRWPANVVHDGSDEVLAAFPDSESGKPRNDRGKGGFWAASNGTPCGPQYGDGGSAARFFFSAKANAQDRWGSRHPTVKPVELMKWLVALVCPPGGLLLDPFAGSGTTGIAALATGRNAILIEREPAYVEDIRERLAFYKGGGAHSMQAKHRNRPADHGPLFNAGPLTAAEEAADSLLSYNTAVTAIGERVKAGEPVPEFMLSRNAPP